MQIAENEYLSLTDPSAKAIAAFLMLQDEEIGDLDGLWTEEDIQSWWTESIELEDMELAWMVREIAASQIFQMTITDSQLVVLERIADGQDLLPAYLASKMLFEDRGQVIDIDARNIRGSRDAALLLYLQASGGGLVVDQWDPTIVDIALSGAGTDDWTWSYLVRAYAAAGEIEQGTEVGEMFDTRRLLADGRVLEQPLFTGTIGSTFRMIRMASALDSTSEYLDENTVKILKDQAVSLPDTDIPSKLAGEALLSILEPGSLTYDERSKSVQDAFAAEKYDFDAMSLEQILNWTALAEYAAELDVTIEFGRLSDEALASLLAEDDSAVIYAISRFILALDAMEQSLDSPDIALLAEKIEKSFVAPISEIDSYSLFAGARASYVLTGIWPYGTDSLLAETRIRSGECLGGFDSFTRIQRATGSACDVDVTLHARLLEKEILEQ